MYIYQRFAANGGTCTTMYKLLIISGLILFLLKSCIDPYQLNLSEYDSLLVVEGMITDENRPYTIALSRTFQNKDTFPEKVRYANVYVTTGDEEPIVFTEKEPGIYQSDPATFRGRAGETYTLHIRTVNNEYVSDPCLMVPVPAIDTVSFVRDKHFSTDGTTELDGVSIFVTPSSATGTGEYLRWDFEETWKVEAPYPVGYQYLGHRTVITIPVQNQTCWKHESSSNILVYAYPSGDIPQVIKQPLTFISPVTTDRLTHQYSILVKQYSLSKEEYDFWNDLKQVSEERGDIFDKQPHFVPGNIHSVKNKSEKVLGYFQVSAVAEKRIYITKHQISNLQLPSFRYHCKIIEVGGEDPAEGQTGFASLDDAYNFYTGIGMVFVYPIYHGLALTGLAFATVACTDCSVAADPVKPDFWIDLP